MISINKEILNLMDLFPESFITRHLELVLVRKENIYFRLEDVENSEDLKCKFIAWLSRPAHKETNPKTQKYILEKFNEYLGTAFSKEDMGRIYTYLGNDCNRNRTREFIRSGYNISVLPE